MIGLLARALGGAVAVLDRVEDRSTPSRCAGWSIADVAAHLVVVTDRFAAFAAGEHLDPSSDLHHAVDRAVATWRAHPEALARTCTLSFGTFDGATAAGINTFDAVVHGWDIAAAARLPYDPDDDLVDVATRIAGLLVWQERQFARPPSAIATTALQRLVVLTGRDPGRA